MRISVIIPCRNEKNYIKECIEAIYASDISDSLCLSVFVVDGMSDDGTREIVMDLINDFQGLKLVDNIQQLTPFAFNLGIHQTPFDYLQIVGARHIISSNYISKSIDILENDKSVWCVGGKLKNEYTTTTSRIIANAMDTSFGMGLGNFRIKENSGFTDTVTSPMYPAFVFEKIGYFDEELIRNQDDDFNFRVSKEEGGIWFESSISLKYYVRASFNGLFKQFFQYGYWKVYVNKKHGEVTTLRQLVPPLFVLYTLLLPFLLGVNFSLFTFASIGLIFYTLLAVFFGMKKSENFKEFFGVVKTFPILHFSYGFGYLQGLIHFFVLNKKPSSKQKTLSR